MLQFKVQAQDKNKLVTLLAFQRAVGPVTDEEILRETNSLSLSLKLGS